MNENSCMFTRSNFFVISSDFCHWGSRFDYQYYEPEHGPIFKSIEVLDKRGMAIIESQVIFIKRRNSMKGCREILCLSKEI